MVRWTGPRQGRWRGRADQARPTLLLALFAASCGAGSGPEDIGPVFTRIVGPAYEGREAPPGADAPFPNLGTVPPRPAVPDPAVRDALTAALAEERQRSRNPLDPEMRPAPMRPAGTAGDRSMPMQPPGPPRLGAAARIPMDEPAPVPAPMAPAVTAPPASAPAAAPSPAAAPAPAPPAREPMSDAPPPPPPADLLAPGAGPPPLPPADLLAPPRR